MLSKRSLTQDRKDHMEDIVTRFLSISRRTTSLVIENLSKWRRHKDIKQTLKHVKVCNFRHRRGVVIIAVPSCAAELARSH